MKMTLNQSIIINKLSIDIKPDLDKDGKVVYLPNPERKTYLITDNHLDSPVGFGVKISATKKIYIVQRRVSSTGNRPKTGGKAPSEVIRSTIGNVFDFANIDQAREVARNSALLWLISTCAATGCKNYGLGYTYGVGVNLSGLDAVLCLQNQLGFSVILPT